MATFHELSDAVFRGDLRTVHEALETDPSLALTANPDGDTLLHFACWAKQLAAVEFLIAARANVDARGCYGRTPLHYAVHEGGANTEAVVRALVGSGADPAILDDNGYTPEAWACVEMVEGLHAVRALLGGRRSPRSGTRREPRERDPITLVLRASDAELVLRVDPMASDPSLEARFIGAVDQGDAHRIDAQVELPPGEMERFADALDALATRGSGVATLPSLATIGLHCAVVAHGGELEVQGSVLGALPFHGRLDAADAARLRAEARRATRVLDGD